jgi:hypothetical protein
MKRLGFSFRKNIEEGTFRVEMQLQPDEQLHY